MVRQSHPRALVLVLTVRGLCMHLCAGCDEQDPTLRAGGGADGSLSVWDSAVQAPSDAGLAIGVDAGGTRFGPDTGALPSNEAGILGGDGSVPWRGEAGLQVPADASSAPPDAAPHDGGGQPLTGQFPRSAEAVNVASKGPYGFKSYSDGLSDPAFESAIMYYPDGAQPPYAAIVLSPGFLASKESYTKLGEIFASHGFAMMLTTPTDVLDFPPDRGKDLVAGVARIKLENERTASPLFGKLAPDRVCITGQSMGGGGTLHGASELGTKIRCVVPLQPWEPGTTFARITAPTLFIGAEADTVAGVAENASVHYASIPSSVEKIYAEFKGADHFLTTNAGTLWEEQSMVMVSFYKLKLEDDQRYAVYLYGGMEPKAALSKYEFSKR
jgi:dienelactone hydrolase